MSNLTDFRFRSHKPSREHIRAAKLAREAANRVLEEKMMADYERYNEYVRQFIEQHGHGPGIRFDDWMLIQEKRG